MVKDHTFALFNFGTLPLVTCHDNYVLVQTILFNKCSLKLLWMVLLVAHFFGRSLPSTLVGLKALVQRPHTCFALFKDRPFFRMQMQISFSDDSLVQMVTRDFVSHFCVVGVELQESETLLYHSFTIFGFRLFPPFEVLFLRP